MTKNIIAGIDIGTSSIRVVVCEYDKNSDCPTVLSFAKKPSRGLRRGYIINFDETVANLKEAIQEAERGAKIKIKRAYLGIGGVTMESRFSEGTIVVSRADLEITKNDVKRAIDEAENNLPDMNNRAVLHRFPAGFKIDGKKILGQPEEMLGTKLETKALFITCSKQHLKDFVRAVEEAGVIVDDIRLYF
jgi:cell division protein FtsA